MKINQSGFSQLIHLLIGIVIGVVILELFIVSTKPQTNSSKLNPLNSTSTSQNLQSKQASSAAVVKTVDIDKLNKYLKVEAALLGINDNFSLYYKNLSQPDKEVTIDPTKSWIPASTIKSFVALEAFRQRDLGVINFDHQITITANNVVSTELETDEFPHLREGTNATIKQLVEAMITQSDNTAYNSLLDVLDRRNINTTLKNLGLTETVVGEKLNLDDGQFQKDLAVTGRQPNTTTAKDLATFFDLLYTHQVADADEILAIFKKQKINNMIPALLPPNIEVAHKTGDWAPIFHDSGIIYKTADPFILTIMSNSNTPSAISQLSKVTYYQDAQTIGQDIIATGKKTSQTSFQPNTYLAESDSQTQVLGEETAAKKFPEVTAEDLGITTNDLSLFDNQDAKKISQAWIIPGSVIYNFKRAFEKVAMSLPWNTTSKVDSDLSQASNRLSELKSTLQKSDLNNGEKVLAESEDDLKKAINDAQGKDNVNNSLTSIKQINDLHFATLAEVAKNIDPSQKEQFVDMVYNFQTKNSQEIKPILAKSVIANPLQQKPLIGTITKVDDKKVEVSFDDGTQKQVNVSNFTPVRDFHNDQIDSQNNFTIGTKLAIIGQTMPNGQISPQFILKNIPHELPDKHQGTVLEIDPKDKILKIKEQNNIETIQIGDSTVVKGSDTSVSLEGIKAGSKVTVFGEYQNATPSASIAPNINPSSTPFASVKNNSSPISSAKPTPKPSGTVGPAPSNTPQSSSNNPVIKATSVSVTQNSSGKNETTKSPPAASSKPNPTTPGSPQQSANNPSTQTESKPPPTTNPVKK